ncbi:hypothetical protein [Photobacterium satsumensis]|uniref:hypothetical protein n=1 Tax=Photobacterium satsumensis TaxID=2910239 RepID=UPI003D0AF67C
MGHAFLRQGLTALANTVNQDPNGWFQGHIGASVIAGTFLLDSGDLNAETREALLIRLNTIVEQHPEFFRELPDSLLISPHSLIAQLDQCANSLSRSGHGVIYGTLTLKTITEAPELAQESILNAVIQLMENTKQDKWDRYYGIRDYRQYLSETKYSDITIEQACEKAIYMSGQNVFLDSDDHFFTGEKIHGITHAQAVMELKRLGFDELAHKAVKQVLLQLDLNEKHPSVGLSQPKPKEFDLNLPELWSEGFTEFHQIKLAYSANEIFKGLGDSSVRPSALASLWGAVNLMT